MNKGISHKRKHSHMKPIPSLDGYYATRSGGILKLTTDTKLNQTLKTVSTNVDNSSGKRRFNATTIEGRGQQKTVQQAQSVYRAFKGKDPKGAIIYVDGDSNNCSADNLMTVDDLLDFYKNMNAILQ